MSSYALDEIDVLEEFDETLESLEWYPREDVVGRMAILRRLRELATSLPIPAWRRAGLWLSIGTLILLFRLQVRLWGRGGGR